MLENLFYQRHITKIFDLKGSSRNRHAEVVGKPLHSFEKALIERRKYRAQLLGGADAAKERGAAVAINLESSNGTLVLPSVENYSLYPASLRRKCTQTLLDDNFVELAGGRPFPLKYRAKVG